MFYHMKNPQNIPNFSKSDIFLFFLQLFSKENSEFPGKIPINVFSGIARQIREVFIRNTCTFNFFNGIYTELHLKHLPNLSGNF